MVFSDLYEINCALGHMTNKMFDVWYDSNEVYKADPTEENKHKLEIAKCDLDMVQKAYKLFNNLGWDLKWYEVLHKGTNSQSQQSSSEM